jgi:hypothetical protein
MIISLIVSSSNKLSSSFPTLPLPLLPLLTLLHLHLLRKGLVRVEVDLQDFLDELFLALLALLVISIVKF